MRLFVSKWTSNQVAVGEVMYRRKERKNDLCPCCGTSTETRIHLLRCPATKSVWKKARKPLKKWFRLQDTDPNISEAIIDILRNFQKRQDYDMYVPQGYSLEIQECLNAQSHLGITNMFEGLLTYDWAKIQQNHYTKIHSRKTGQKWAAGLSTQLWKIIYHMWDHRNHILHHKDTLDTLSGLDIVKAAIKEEVRKGPLTLDPIYNTYFHYTHTQIQKMKSVDARNWLTLIRRAREAKGFVYTDTISQSRPLKKWIGLTYRKKAKQTYLALAHTGYRH